MRDNVTDLIAHDCVLQLDQAYRSIRTDIGRHHIREGPVPMPKAVRAEWTTPDGKRHCKEIAIEASVPSGFLVRGATSQLTFRIVGADEIAVLFEAQDPRPHPDAALPDHRILQPKSPVAISDCRNEG